MIAKTAVVQVADYLNPLLSSPAGPLEGVAMAMSFEPSLMPRNSVQQGIMMGLAGLTARGLGGAVEKGHKPSRRAPPRSRRRWLSAEVSA